MTLDAPRNVSLFDVDNVTAFGPVRDMTVTRVSAADVDEFCRRWHYTGTKGSAMWNYGLWDGITLVGVVAYNIPTNEACGSVFGLRGDPKVLHMGRLVCAERAPRNVESKLIAASLKSLHHDTGALAVLTYAAQDEGHIGYVYQATNALYTGIGGDGWIVTDASGKRRSTYLSGKAVNAQRLAQLGWTRVKGLPKHRYVYLLGNRSTRRESLNRLLFPVLPYPKATTEQAGSLEQ